MPEPITNPPLPVKITEPIVIMPLGKDSVPGQSSSTPNTPNEPGKQFVAPPESDVVITPPKPKANIPVLDSGPPSTFSSPPLPATTTAQEDVTTAGQRRINLIWEITQSLIALMITGAIIYTAVTKTPVEVLTNSFFLIIGFYYSRTNHQAIGGVGSQPTTPYTGR